MYVDQGAGNYDRTKSRDKRGQQSMTGNDVTTLLRRPPGNPAIFQVKYIGNI
jgi:hypothetical protein